MEYVRNKKRKTILKPVENASDYISTGEWEKVSKKEYDDSLKKEKEEPEKSSSKGIV